MDELRTSTVIAVEMEATTVEISEAISGFSPQTIGAGDRRVDAVSGIQHRPVWTSRAHTILSGALRMIERPIRALDQIARRHSRR